MGGKSQSLTSLIVRCKPLWGVWGLVYILTNPTRTITAKSLSAKRNGGFSGECSFGTLGYPPPPQGDIAPMSDTYEPVDAVDTFTTDVEPAAEPPTPDETTPHLLGARAIPTDLEGDLKKVLDGIVLGSIVLPAGKHATPHVLAGLIEEARGLGGSRPSTGAVASALSRWEQIGYITCTEAPTGFAAYTDAAVTDGLGALKKQHRERLGAARAASRPVAPAVASDVPVDTSAPF